MIDDPDRCEWVNVSSGTVSPVDSRTTVLKTVLVVVVAVAVAVVLVAVLGTCSC